MPPRHVYWTIIAGGQPTAFRAAEREELLPTLKQLQSRHPDATMMWFARGKLWPTKEAAEFALRQERHRGGEQRGKGWRPGGEHKDPRYQFKVPRDVKRARFAERARRDRIDGGAPPKRSEEQQRPPRPTAPRGDRAEGDRPFRPREDRPQGDRPFRPKGDRPQGDRPFRPKGDGPYGSRPASPKPPKGQWGEAGPYRPREDRPQGDRPFRPKGDRPPGARPFRPKSDRPAGDRPFKPKGTGGGFKPRGGPPKGRSGGGPGSPKPRSGGGGGNRGGGGGRGPR